MSQPQEMKITITVHSNGSLQITGNIESPLIAYGMLEMARDEIRKYHEKKSESKIVAPPPGLKIERAN